MMRVLYALYLYIYITYINIHLYILMYICVWRAYFVSRYGYAYIHICIHTYVDMLNKNLPIPMVD